MSLSGYFGRFGQIVNVQVLPDEDKAYVQFSTHESAAAAVSSPKAVFGNRFIKLVWAKFNPINKLALIDESKSEIATQELKAKFTPSIPDAEIEKKINELKEKTKAKQDIVNKLKDMKGVNPDRQKMIANLESEIATFGSQIAALESGDLPEELFNQESNADGRGRGGFRGRGRGAPAVRGRRPSATMKWDSRTKTVLVHGIPEHLAKEPILRSHFQTYGQILKVAMDIQGTGTALVEFDNRSNAQFAIKRGSKLLGADLNLVFYEQPEDSSQSDLNTSIQTEDFTAAQYPSEDEEDDDDRGDRSWKR
jgi:RNA-binding protein 26